ncbi:MAG: ERCC4 domain-containing protein [Candidatus Micrarchaeia archaeon]|jgi:Fanconi anemia group M protein
MDKVEHPKIFVDDRELKSGVARQLFDLGALLMPKRLEVGDYVASDRVVFERKTASDFEQSIIDGRLFSQAKALNDSYAAPIIAIIGHEILRVNPKAARGALLSLATDYKIPVFIFETESELGEFIYAAAFREQFGEKREPKINLEKRSLPLHEEQQFIVESLPQVGPVQAKKLLEEFGSVRGVFNASEKDLMRTGGIGEIRAKKIREMVEAEYGKE